jgi:hypothetical protein
MIRGIIVECIKHDDAVVVVLYVVDIGLLGKIGPCFNVGKGANLSDSPV